MEDFRRRLPPLDTLIFFEAAVRRGSFTKAADKLSVTQAAVSKRIQQLEDWMGQQLFQRAGRRLTLTDEGQQLRDSTVMALDYLETAFDALARRDVGAVRIAAQSSLAMFWLLPRLKSFGLGENSGPINLHTSDRSGDLLRSENDLVLLYGKAIPAGWQGRALLPEVLAPVASPALAERYRISSQQSLLALSEAPPLLNFARLAPDWINWDSWAKQVGLAALLSLPQVQCRSYANSIGEAIRGKGIALGSLALIEPELASGRLVRVGDRSLETGLAFSLAYPETKPLRENVRLLYDFLAAEADAPSAPKLDRPSPRPLM